MLPQKVYQSDLEYLSSDCLLTSFLSYYNERNEIDPPLESGLVLELIRIHLKQPPSFQYPRLVKINKMGSKNRRDVFIFPDREQLLLKYINYAISSLNLDIHPGCYSFQRGHRIVDAIRTLQRIDAGNKKCIKVDIRDYFNSIQTGDLLSWLPPGLTKYAYITAVIDYLLRRELVWIDGYCRPYAKRGVMAGMPLSATLSNLYLKSFDQEMASAYPAYARYSDDMVIFFDDKDPDLVYKHIESALTARGLTINCSKTRVFEPGEGFEFLGLKVQNGVVDLSPATIDKVKAKIRRQVRSLYRWQVRKGVPVEKTAMVMNRKFYGLGASETDFTWSKYFFHVLTVDHGLRNIDHYYQEAIRYLAAGRYRKGNYRDMPYGMLKENGYMPLVTAFYSRHDLFQPENSTSRDF